MNARVGAVPTVQKKMSKSVDRRCPKGLKEGKTGAKGGKSMTVKAGNGHYLPAIALQREVEGRGDE